MENERDLDSEISRLEWAVVEAAVAFHQDFAWSGQFANARAIKVYDTLQESVEALIVVRKEAEQNSGNEEQNLSSVTG